VKSCGVRSTAAPGSLYPEPDKPYDKLDIISLAFITLALAHDGLRNVNTP